MVPGSGLEPARGRPQGIFVPLQLSLLHARAMHFVVWTLPLPSRHRSLPAVGLGRGRQVSTLSLTDGRSAVSPAVDGLSSVLQPPCRAAVPPTLTPFTPAVSGPGAQML